MDVEIITGVLVAAVGLVGTLVAWLGHRVLRSNAELSAHIARDNARLTTSLEAAKQLAHNRQVWIDHLRDDMARYFSLTLESNSAKRDYRLIYETGAKIELRMNPEDPDYLPLRKAMHACTVTDDKEAIGRGREEYFKVSQRILKREREVLKRELSNFREQSALSSK